MENFYKTRYILKDIKDHVKNKKPFSIVRTGDGGIKYIHAVLNNDINSLKVICEKEGIPLYKSKEILELWKTSINMSDYVDTPGIYYNHTFWPRVRKNGKDMSETTKIRLMNWKMTYDKAGFDIKKYCNPEINFLMCLDYFNDLNLLEIMKNKKICIVTCYDKIKDILEDYDIDILKISGFYENQFAKSFQTVILSINQNATNYDMWLIACGELGRIYPGLIKYRGGVAIDVGSLIDYWCTGIIPIRLELFMKQNRNNKLKLDLTDMGMKYKRWI